MFGHDSKPSRIFGGYAAKVVENEAGLLDQLRLADDYRRELIRNERRRRYRVQDVVRQRHPDVADLEQAVERAVAMLDAAKAAVKSANQKGRGQVASQEARDAVTVARKHLKDRSAAWKEARKAAYADPATKAELQAVDAEAAANIKRLRSGTRLYWGTKGFIENSCRSMRVGPPPRYRDDPDVGGLAVQVQKGMDWTTALLGHDPRFRLTIEPVRRPADPQSKRSGESIATAWFRIGSADSQGRPGSGGQTPVWAKVRFRMFRVPPPDARIKWVYLHRFKVGPVYQWNFSMVLEREAGWDASDRAESGVCGIDLGWRLVPDGLRVAYLSDDAGHEESLVIPHERLSAWKQVDDLRSIRDRRFDEVRPVMTAWAREHAAILPEWWATEFAHLASWRSAERLRGVVEAWRGTRFAGDDEIFATAEAWRKKDKHLHHWQEALRLKTIRWRDLFFRQWVGKVAKLYRVVGVEDMNIRKLREKPGEDVPADDPSRDVARTGGYAHIASIGRLRQFLKEKVVEVVEVKAKDTTRTCHDCGHVNEFKQAASLLLVCQNSECGATWDQDANASRNLRDAAAQIASADVV